MKYDSVYGCFDGVVGYDVEFLMVNGDCIVIIVIWNFEELFWGDFYVDVVFECIGLFIKCDVVVVYFEVGVCKVIILVFLLDVDVIVVYGVNY